MIIHDCEQGSETWDRLRLAIPTASEFDKIITPTGQLSKQSEAYMNKLLAEWLYGAPLEDVETQWMQRGKDLEAQAVSSYEFETDRETQKVGFITTDGGMVGCSPDRLVIADGLLEIKCPAPHTHVGYMVKRSVNKDYFPQLQGQLWIAEREWVDIQSYCPCFPTVIMRVTRNEEYINKLKEALCAFLETMLKAREALEKTYGTPQPSKRTPPDALGVSDEDGQGGAGEGELMRRPVRKTENAQWRPASDSQRSHRHQNRAPRFTAAWLRAEDYRAGERNHQGAAAHRRLNGMEFRSSARRSERERLPGGGSVHGGYRGAAGVSGAFRGGSAVISFVEAGR